MDFDFGKELNEFLGAPRRMTRAEQEDALFQRFIRDKVDPAFKTIADELSKRGREVSVRDTVAAAILTVRKDTSEEISFAVMRRNLPTAIVPYAEVRLRERRGLRLLKSEVNLHENGAYAIDDVTSEDVVHTFLRCYRKVFEG